MTEANPDPVERRREQNRRYREANRDKINEQRRQYRAANRDKLSERNRRYREANQVRIAEQKRQRYLVSGEAVRAKVREYWSENRETYSARSRIKRANGYKSPAQRRRDEIKAKLWRNQDGRCYLCEEVLSLEDAYLDHDHRCCPEQRFCSFCIRGLSHPSCNYLIGQAGDDPDRLERIARNLRAMLAEVDRRLASKPVQAQLELE